MKDGLVFSEPQLPPSSCFASVEHVLRVMYSKDMHYGSALA